MFAENQCTCEWLVSVEDLFVSNSTNVIVIVLLLTVLMKRQNV